MLDEVKLDPGVTGSADVLRADTLDHADQVPVPGPGAGLGQADLTHAVQVQAVTTEDIDQ